MIARWMETVLLVTGPSSKRHHRSPTMSTPHPDPYTFEGSDGGPRDRRAGQRRAEPAWPVRGPLRPQRTRKDTRPLDHAASDQVSLDDPLENRRVARAVPRPFRVDDGDRPAFADPQAVGLGAQHPALLGQPQLAQPALQIGPGGEAALAIAALRMGLVGAEQHVPLRRGHPDGGGSALLALDGALAGVGSVHHAQLHARAGSAREPGTAATRRTVMDKGLPTTFRRAPQTAALRA